MLLKWATRVDDVTMLDFIQGASFFLFAWIASLPDTRRIGRGKGFPHHFWSRARLCLYMYFSFSLLIALIKAI